MDRTQYTTNKADRKPGKHLTMEDRGAIEAMKKLGQSNRAIARYLNCSPTTVSNESKRGTRPKNGRSGRTPGYCAKRGMLVYQTHRANSHKPHSLRKGSTFVQWVLNQVRQEKWSLDACVGYARKHKLFLPTEMVCTKTLYNEVWAGNLVLESLELPEALKRKKCCKSTGNRKKAYGTSIDERPQIASSRLEVGHWEGDTVVGKRNGKEAVILTLLEKKTQHYLAIRIPGKTSEAVSAAMQKLREDFGEPFFSQIFKTITVDNGPEFADFAQTEQFGTKVYFAHPYTSWERAQDEQENGMLRRYVPKGVYIENFSCQNLIKAFNNPIASGNAENGIRGKRANGIAETINDFHQGCKNLVSKAALSYLLPDLLYRIHLWCVWRDMEKYNILRHFQCSRFVPCSSIAAHQNGVLRKLFG